MAMVGNAKEFADWNDFPHGLRVLVVDKDVAAVNRIKLILEGYHYIVSVCTKGENAIAEVQDHPGFFHVALVEATKDKELDGFQVLKATRDVPSIMMTTEDDMAIMMQGIALGAVDFLQKPLTEEKLGNIWQHVVRKAFVTGFPAFKIPLQQSKLFEQDLSPSIDSLKTEAQGSNADISQMYKDHLRIDCRVLAQGSGTIQLEQSGRVRSREDFLDVSSVYERFTKAKREAEELKRELLDCTYKSLHSQVKVEDEPCSKVEFLDSFSDIGLRNTSFGDEGSNLEIDPAMFFELPDSDSDSFFDVNFNLLDSSLNQDAVNYEECLLAEELINSGQEYAGRENSKSSLQSPTLDSRAGIPDKIGDQANSGEFEKSIKTALKKKMKVDWTPKLHHKFVQAVEQLGVENAIPSKIMDLMGVKCLTRHNISSHLQKYRSNKKHLPYRASEASHWSKCTSTSSCAWSKTSRDRSPLPSQLRSSFVPIQPRLPMVHFAPAEPTVPVPRVPMLVWGHPSNDHTPTHTWQQQHLMKTPTTWQAPDGTLWQHPATDFHTWIQAGLETKLPQLGHPVMSVPLGAAPSLRTEAITPFPVLENSSSEYIAHLKASEMTSEAALPTQSIVHGHKDMVSAAINEALKNPTMPLPLGLRSPSMESIMAELQIQGIHTVKIPA